MERNASGHRTLVGLITVALVGLTVLQFFLLRFAWELENQAFVRNVDTALNLIAAQLESDEIFDGAVGLLELTAEGDVVGLNAGRIVKASAHLDSIHTEIKRYTFGGSAPDSLTIVDDARIWRIAMDAPGMHVVAVEAETTCPAGAVKVVVNRERDDLIRHIVGDLVARTPRPIDQRLAETNMDSLLVANLRAVGVDAEPAYGVLMAGTDSLVAAGGGGGDPAHLSASGFRTRLYPLDPTPPLYDLALHFPGERVYLAGRIWPFWLASIVFMTVIVASFVRTLRANAAQRRYAGHLVDFVNNMTHEFKTPISTVALASEALSREDVTSRPDALRRYADMIRQENRRMAGQVERILEIAQLESGDFRPDLVPVDVGGLVADVAASFVLDVAERGGRLSVAPAAPDARALADDVHLAGAVANLIDNAVKHAGGAPEIDVGVRSADGRLEISVADRGPGVPESERERVFEKYYRGHTGNRHDVKGFGLGLSYVKLVAEAHGGRAVLSSRRGGGTLATLILPRLDGSGPGRGARP
jgi:two-component system phosphate regulon sensor histidine kinase PhoR